jgi:Zn-dependent M28 family amino/carboxypeptidase
MSIIEAIWQEEKERKRRLRMAIIIVAFFFLVILITVWSMITQPLLFGSGAINLPSKVDPQRLEAHVRTISESFAPRDWSHPENLDRVAGYIQQEFEKAKGTVIDQPFEAHGRGYRNVIAVFGPDTKERVVVGAHYDSFDQFPAADDNASGVAGLIELAQLLGNSSIPVRVELVAYTLEEPPFFRTEKMGSAIHAASLKKEDIPVRAMLSLEMIGCFTDSPDSQRFPLSILKAFYPSKGNFIAVVGKLGQGSLVRRVKGSMRAASSLPVYSINAPGSIPGIDFSDQLNYWESGYDAVMISDTAFYRNRRYHTPQDRADTLDYKRMAMVVEGVYAAVIDLSK